jgi:hypothetical protein
MSVKLIVASGGHESNQMQDRTVQTEDSVRSQIHRSVRHMNPTRLQVQQ